MFYEVGPFWNLVSARTWCIPSLRYAASTINMMKQSCGDIPSVAKRVSLAKTNLFYALRMCRRWIVNVMLVAFAVRAIRISSSYLSLICDPGWHLDALPLQLSILVAPILVIAHVATPRGYQKRQRADTSLQAERGWVQASTSCTWTENIMLVETPKGPFLTSLTSGNP